MNTIAFIDTEIEPESGKILDIGSVRNDGSVYHKASVTDFSHFLTGTQFICGHNILKHDIKYIRNALYNAGISSAKIIDTLFLSSLIHIFPLS